jgi:hypothetical protein
LSLLFIGGLAYEQQITEVGGAKREDVSGVSRHLCRGLSVFQHMAGSS